MIPDDDPVVVVTPDDAVQPSVVISPTVTGAQPTPAEAPTGPSPVQRALGASGGVTPITDATMRAMMSGAVLAILGVLARRTDLLTDADVATLAPVATLIAFLVWGVLDRFYKHETPSA